jgi:hypothetical protein
VFLLREVPHSTLGPLHAVFGNRPATKADLGGPLDDLFPVFVTERYIARGGKPRLAYSQKHLEAAIRAIAEKREHPEQTNTTESGDALSDLKVELLPDASPKINIRAVHGSNGLARTHYEDLSRAWQAQAQNETRRAVAAEQAGSEAVSWSEGVRRALPSQGRSERFCLWESPQLRLDVCWAGRVGSTGKKSVPESWSG